MRTRIMLPVAAALAIFCAGGAQAENQKFEKDGWTYIETEAPDTKVSSFLVYKEAEDDKAFVMKCDAPGPQALYLGFFAGGPGKGKMVQTQGSLGVDDNVPVQLPISVDGSVAYIYDAPSIAKVAAFMEGGKAFEFKATDYDPADITLKAGLTGFKEAHEWVAGHCKA